MPLLESFNGLCFFPGVGTSGEIEKDNAEIVNGRLYAIHTDQLNTPRQLTDENGQKVWQWAISGFGELEPTTAQTGWIRARNGSAGQISNTLPVTFNLRFPGQQFDEETGLHYNHHRYYDPYLTVGYTEADPLGLSAGWNRFLYAESDPFGYSDAEGLAACTYSINPPELVCKSTRNKPSPLELKLNGEKNIFSGDKVCKNNNSPECISKRGVGPIPPGCYKVVRHENREKFWRLISVNWSKLDSLLYNLGFGRSGFMLHPGSISAGCITIKEPGWSQYELINKLLNEEDGENFLCVF